MSNVFKKLAAVQSEVKATKDAYNAFGKYHYRSCESILEAVKPILKKNNSLIILNDDKDHDGDRYYIVATAKFIDCETGESVEVTALAREEETKKGMDGAQITGSASSYARKYALAGLLLLDDNKDPDASNKHGKDDDTPFPKADETITQDKVNELNTYLSVYPKKEQRESVVTALLNKYGVNDMSKLTTTTFVRFRQDLLDGAEKIKKQRLEKMVNAYAKKVGISAEDAREQVETGIGKKIDSIYIAEFRDYAKKITDMVNAVTEGAGNEQADD